MRKVYIYMFIINLGVPRQLNEKNNWCNVLNEVALNDGFEFQNNVVIIYLF